VVRGTTLLRGAAGLFAAALGADPKLADDLRAGHRYAAARAAVAAGGHGEEAAKPDEQERARLRKQARDWLRADLAAWATVLEKGPPQARPVVQRTLGHWRQDPDLGGLRDKAELARLPEAERRACRDLWAEVDALLRRTQPKPGQP
jgi:hypothetical protein